jgi:hypothetical protein
MHTAVIPIQKISIDSTLTTSVSRSSALPPLLREMLKAWLFLRVLRFVNAALSGQLGKLSVEQATDLYGPLFQLHMEANAVLENLSRRSRLERTVSSWWDSRVRAEADRLGDIVEAIAWGSDPDLRRFVDESLVSLESR